MNESINQEIMTWLHAAWLWVQQHLLEPERLVELVLIAAAFLLANVATRFVKRGIERSFNDIAWIEKFQHRLIAPLSNAALTMILIWSTRLMIEPWLGQAYLMGGATSLLAAWVVIRVAVSVLDNREFARMIAVVAWTIAALNIIGLLGPMTQVLDAAEFPLGDSSISVLDILKGIFSLAVFVWLAMALSSLIDKQLLNVESMPPSVRVLIGKSAKIVLISVAFLVALNATGVDLTALAVFGGALGVGIGFGLQKVVGNFISGIILLVDRSIKPGDVIETGGTYGRINKLAARYTSVITRDGTEFLIPNEDMITQPVVNWSHSHKFVRRRIPVQVSYDSDVRKAMSLMRAAATETPRVLSSPEVKTLLRGFGSDGIDLELRMWLNDPGEGVSNVASEVMLKIWDKFKENDIEFPFPQRVVHIKNDGMGGNKLNEMDISKNPKRPRET